MFRSRYARIYELYDLVPRAEVAQSYFSNLQTSLTEIAQKRHFYDELEASLSVLDDAAWSFLKEEALPYALKRDPLRHWQQFFDVLNQAKAYRHLKSEGCSQIEFIPRAKRRGRQTPDLKAYNAETLVLCEVKTINVSQQEVERRQARGVGTTAMLLNESFLEKLASTVDSAEAQMNAYHTKCARRIVYIVVNFDDNLHEYADAYRAQLREYMSHAPDPGAEVCFDIRDAFANAKGAI